MKLGFTNFTIFFTPASPSFGIHYLTFNTQKKRLWKTLSFIDLAWMIFNSERRYSGVGFRCAFW